MRDNSMQNLDLNGLLSLASDTAKGAIIDIMAATGQFRYIREDLPRDVKIEADHKLEEFIIRTLSKGSDYPILSEEGGGQGNATNCGWRWIIDPLDGSMNFSRGIPMCCISIGLWKGMEPMLGVVYDFNRDETFAGIVGKGAWLNESPIKVSAVTVKSKAVLCTGFPVSTDFSKESLLAFVEDIKNYKKIRLLGSAALSLAYVASGRADCYIEKNIKIWDVAAGIAIVKAAGGFVRINRSDIKDALWVKASSACLRETGLI